MRFGCLDNAFLSGVIVLCGQKVALHIMYVMLPVKCTSIKSGKIVVDEPNMLLSRARPEHSRKISSTSYLQPPHKSHNP